MSTQVVTPAKPEVMKALFSEMDKRYASAESVSEISRSLLEMAKSRRAPVVISNTDNDRAEAARVRLDRIRAMEYSLGKLFYVQLHHKNRGNFPGEKQFAKEVDYAKKAISEGTSAAGGTLIPQEWTDFILPELGARAVMLKSGPVVLPMQTNVLNVPGLDSPDAACQWLGENAASTEASPPTRNVQLKLNTARLLSQVSLEFLRDATPETDAALQANVVRIMARFVDLGYLAGTGSSNQPTGLSVASGITSIITAADAGTGGAIAYDDLSNCVYSLEKNNAPEEGRAWFMNPRTFDKIRRLKDSYGRPLFVPDPHMAMQPTLFGYPVYQTTQIAINQTKGTGTNLTYLLLVAMSDVLVGIGHNTQGIEIAVSDQAAFANAAYQIRVLFRTDIQPGHPVSVVNLGAII